MTKVAHEDPTAELTRELEAQREQQEAIKAVLSALAGTAGL
jgi:hypothetical protein